MSHSNTDAARLLIDHLPLLVDLRIETSVLDLACGNGRNGMLLSRHNIPVTFADNNAARINSIENSLSETEPPSKQKDSENGAAGGSDRRERPAGEIWQVDFEEKGTEPLLGKCFDAVLVFNYLHRPLMDAIRTVIRPGGMIFYETFTVQQRQFGKPSNSDYLLRTGELKAMFDGWEQLHYLEGIRGLAGEQDDPRCAKASLIARKPS